MKLKSFFSSNGFFFFFSSGAENPGKGNLFLFISILYYIKGLFLLRVTYFINNIFLFLL